MFIRAQIKRGNPILFFIVTAEFWFSFSGFLQMSCNTDPICVVSILTNNKKVI